MSEKRKPEDVPLGTGMASKAAKLLAERKERERKMRKRFGISSPPKPNSNN